jgi:hypothetical protein
MLAIAAIGLVFPVSQLSAVDHAFATAGASGENLPSSISSSGPLSASVHYDSTTDPHWNGSTNSIVGDASVNADISLKEISLKVKASASGVIGDPSSGGGNATWMDHITLSNPQGILIPNGAHVFYEVSLGSGTLSGTSSASFNTQGTSNGNTVFTQFQENTPGTYGPYAPFASGPLFLSEVMTFGMDFQMSLAVSAAVPTGAGDFSHTATFVAFVVGDANGNPVSGLDTLVFTGDSGFVYPVQAVPEPSAALLLVIGTALLAWRRLDIQK